MEWWLNSSNELNISATDVGAENRTVTDFWYYDWLLHEIHSTRVAGPGSQASCAATALTGTMTLGDGSSGCICVLSPPVPAGVGERLAIQQPIYFGQFGTIPFVNLNVTYGSSPIAAFSWHETNGNVMWSNPGNFNGTPVTVGPFSENGTVIGLALTTRFSGLRFEVPINLTAGGMEEVPETLPSGLPNATADHLTLATVMTYILPAADDQGTWDVFLPGSGGPLSLEGLLFEQIAT